MCKRPISGPHVAPRIVNAWYRGSPTIGWLWPFAKLSLGNGTMMWASEVQFVCPFKKKAVMDRLEPPLSTPKIIVPGDLPHYSSYPHFSRSVFSQRERLRYNSDPD